MSRLGFFPHALAIAVTAVATLSIPAIAADFHVSADPAKALYCRSAFGHGYMHGYEEGFHVADEDLQMARGVRDVSKMAEFKKSGYHVEFGSKRQFEEGYHDGFRVGYIDGISGRKFRAIETFRKAAEGLPDTERATGDEVFDQAFATGYKLGQNHGLSDGRKAQVYSTSDYACVAPHKTENAAAYCDAHRRGYDIGYADGYTNQRDTTILAARR